MNFVPGDELIIRVTSEDLTDAFRSVEILANDRSLLEAESRLLGLLSSGNQVSTGSVQRVCHADQTLVAKALDVR